ncbi:unnamed protein product, partial [Ixodes persulcatus]
TVCRPKQENHRSGTTEVEQRALRVQRTHHPRLVLRRSCAPPAPPAPCQLAPWTSGHLHRSLPAASRDRHNQLVHRWTGDCG